MERKRGENEFALSKHSIMAWRQWDDRMKRMDKCFWLFRKIEKGCDEEGANEASLQQAKLYYLCTILFRKDRIHYGYTANIISCWGWCDVRGFGGVVQLSLPLLLTLLRQTVRRLRNATDQSSGDNHCTWQTPVAPDSRRHTDRASEYCERVESGSSRRCLECR